MENLIPVRELAELIQSDVFLPGRNYVLIKYKDKHPLCLPKIQLEYGNFLEAYSILTKMLGAPDYPCNCESYTKFIKDNEQYPICIWNFDYYLLVLKISVSKEDDFTTYLTKERTA